MKKPDKIKALIAAVERHNKGLQVNVSSEVPAVMGDPLESGP
jgi:transcription antitermination factor NusA-like protein